ncbi:ABC transporter G family member 1 isoform X6 [Elaeis guineensis]|uniref:ABC transporter G family member 11 isoform X4 n=1 Tax=Elaeis guineensis var. tenera TaxID=51953 RepID=A0A6I9S5A7_ELAGV|nr:ABC transporter G family member 11 isoform X4 [Elaeis guineensis]
MSSMEGEVEVEMEEVCWNAMARGGDRPVEIGVRSGWEEEGLYLTWEDLWVTATNGEGSSRVILAGLTGYARPGEVLAIMGPSGCGKSTLLNALAGRLDSGTNQSGHVLVNGWRQRLAFGTSAYVTQDDILMTTLTVREAVYYSAQLQLPDSMTKSEKKERAEMTIREMGLQEAMNTRIGGQASKGISGGQKRRVSICIEILTRPKLLFLDEPTSGLDSAASYHVMNRIVNLARHDGRTIIASIHQPSSEVFELFDNLCLLSSGKTVYFGPASLTNEFFAQNGFPCPSLRNPSDHYLRTINKDFDEETVRGSSSQSKTTAEAIDILVKSYKLSNIRQEVERRVAEMHRLARGSVLLFISAFLTFMAIGGFPSFVEEMKIFQRERLNGHYGVTAFMISNMLSSAPYLALVSIIPGAMAYYLVGLQHGVDHFIFFVVVLYASMLLVEGLMMIVASIVPNYLMGIIAGAGIQAMMILAAGFFRLPNDIPKPVWRYPIYHIAFHKYTNQAYYKNEFIGLTFPNIQAGRGATITGEEVVKDFWQMEVGYSKWVDLAILFGMVILYRVLFLVIVKTGEKVKPMIRAVLNGPPKHGIQVMGQPSTPLADATL